MSFFLKDDIVSDKYNKIWSVIENKLNIKFYCMPVYDKTHIKVKVREFDGKIKRNFLGNKAPKENMYYTCITCVTIDSVMKMGKKLFSFFIHTLWLLTDMLHNKKSQNCLTIKVITKHCNNA